MTRLLTIALVLLVAPWAGAETPSERPAFAKLRPDAQVLVQTWLNKNCGAAEQRVFENQLLEVGSVVEPVFWEAFRLGPTEQEVHTLSAAVCGAPELASTIRGRKWARKKRHGNWRSRNGNTPTVKSRSTPNGTRRRRWLDWA